MDNWNPLQVSSEQVSTKTTASAKELDYKIIDYTDYKKELSYLWIYMSFTPKVAKSDGEIDYTNLSTICVQTSCLH